MFLLLAVILSGLLHGAEYEYLARVESVRKQNELTLLFAKKPEVAEYLIFHEKMLLGTVTIHTVSHDRHHGYYYRAWCRLFLAKEEYRILLRAGSRAGLVKKREPYKQDYSQHWYNEKRDYKKEITTEPDKREMVLVPDGKFIFGSNHGEEDESPEQTLYQKGFYIDRYEVSNSDYYRYMIETNGAPPVAWKGVKYPAGEGDFPVLVSWHQAASYAAWAKKRLPTEIEWEKAARGMKKGKKYTNIPEVYPWGSSFDPELCNGAPYWKKHGKKGQYSGIMSVTSFATKDRSPFGAVNMAGNVMEWTSSWYQPYKGNFKVKGEYGTQYRVIRGGTWFSEGRELRVTNRKFGGIPDLYRDNTAGFRCVRDIVSEKRSGN